MLKYATGRILLAIPTLLLLITMIFTAIRIVPTDIADLMVTQGGSVAAEQSKEAIRKELDLDKPLPVQLVLYIGKVLQGDLGRSAYDRKLVSSKLLDALPVTLELAFFSIVMSTAAAILIGVISALGQDAWYDYVIRLTTIFAFAAPVFWVGTLAVVVPAILWNYSPPLFVVPFFKDPWVNLQQFLLPAVVVALNLVGSVARMVRSSMLEVLRQDYIRTAYAKGLQTRVVVQRHALRNGFIPVLTFLGLQLSNLLGGAAIIEAVFALPGLGTLTINSVSFKDYPVIQGCVLFFGTVVILVNLLVDLSYAVVDPRLRRS